MKKLISNSFTIKKTPSRLLSRLVRLPAALVSQLYLLRISNQRNVHISGNITIYGLPIIDIRDGANLYVGDGVRLNSDNRGYHINMHSAVKLLADWPGAEIHIGPKTRIHGSCIHAYESVVIGSRCLIAANCQIMDGSGHELSFHDVDNRINTVGGSKPVTIGDSVWVGANCIILPGTTIGRGSVISANSVVSGDIPPMVLAGGNPAKIIRRHDQEELV